MDEGQERIDPTGQPDQGLAGGSGETQPGEQGISTDRAASKPRRSRSPRSFPASSFLEALPLAEAIQKHASGQKVRRLTLFEQLGRSADSGPSRQLITNSGQYGLTKGSYSAEFLELTETGKVATDEDSSAEARLAARLKLAIADQAPFNALYERFQGNRLPGPSVLRDAAIESGVTEDNADECVETFLANARELGVVRTYAGAERVLTFEILLEEARSAEEAGSEFEGAKASTPDAAPPDLTLIRGSGSRSTPDQVVAETHDLTKVCFLITPIGSEGSEQRKHADLVLGSLVEPALEGIGLRLVRADRISKPGMITGQVIEHIVRARLVIADLSFGNPNVFYELALRHASRRPAVQIIRTGDHLPFDVGQFRTVTLDMTDIFTLVPKMDSYRAEIARQCRAAVENESGVDSPLSLFYPRFWDQFAT